jgi:hypothetical protein
VEVVGDRVRVELADAAFFRPDHRGEVAEVIGSERDVRGGRLADGLAVLQLSATASISRFSSIASAILLRTF